MTRRGRRVRIGPLVLGERPLFCVTVLEATVAATVAQAWRAIRAGADCLELRLDRLRSDGDVAAALSRLPGVPAVAVCRRPEWDGFFDGPEQKRVGRLAAAIEAGAPAVDVDLVTPPALRADIIRRAKARGVTVLVSYENFERTPPASRLLAILERQKALGADVAKFAVMANSYRDALTVLEATLAADRTLGIPFVAIAMGPYGSLTRPVALLLGAAMTYCAAARGKEGAPGQLPVVETRRMVELLSGRPLVTRQPVRPAAEAGRRASAQPDGAWRRAAPGRRPRAAGRPTRDRAAVDS